MERWEKRWCIQKLPFLSINNEWDREKTNGAFWVEVRCIWVRHPSLGWWQCIRHHSSSWRGYDHRRCPTCLHVSCRNCRMTKLLVSCVISPWAREVTVPPLPHLNFLSIFFIPMGVVIQKNDVSRKFMGMQYLYGPCVCLYATATKWCRIRGRANIIVNIVTLFSSNVEKYGINGTATAHSTLRHLSFGDYLKN